MDLEKVFEPQHVAKLVARRMIGDGLEKVYEPQRFEPHWAQWWVESGIYHAKHQPGKPVSSLVIPPPNVTGVLHMGHMLEHTERCPRSSPSGWRFESLRV